VWGDAMVKVAKRDDFVCAIATVSNTMSNKMIKFKNQNVMTLPHAIDWERFEGVERSKEILKEFGVPDGFVVGFVGRLSPEKNIPCLLQCAKQMPEVSFVIVGKGPQEQPLKQLAKDLKNVFFIGERRDVEKFYAAFDVLMLSSTMEGLPLVILEAMVTGTPVVASNVGAVSELVIDGMNGFSILNSNNYLLFGEAIEKLKNVETWKVFSENSKLVAKTAKEKAQAKDINSLYNRLF
jgi:glycosyltransferase involved in cell wall biosynthesis